MKIELFNEELKEEETMKYSYSIFTPHVEGDVVYFMGHFFTITKVKGLAHYDLQLISYTDAQIHYSTLFAEPKSEEEEQ